MNLGGTEILVILVLALVIFGPKKLPEMGKSLGKAIREFKSAGDEIKDEITKAADEMSKDDDNDDDKTIKPPKTI